MAPSTALKATLTSPSRRVVPSQIASGNLPAVLSRETWAKTKGGLGADSSRTISQRGGAPAWVIATLQPAGGTPGTALSNRIVSEWAAPASNTAAAAQIPIGRISFTTLPYESEDYLSVCSGGITQAFFRLDANTVGGGR